MSRRRFLRLGVVILLLQAGPLLAEPARLGERLDRVLHRLPQARARISARIVSLPEGAIVYERNADDALIPASNQKIVSAAAALSLLGVDYHFETTLGIRGDDLVLIGGGDPALGDPRLAARHGGNPLEVLTVWAEQLRNRGITRVEGGIIVQDGVFDHTWTHPSWEAGDLVKWYAAPVGGLNLHDNCIEVTLRPAAQGSGTTFSVFPENAWVTVRNACRRGAKNAPIIHRSPEQSLYWLRGTCSKPTTLPEVPVTDPGIFAGEAFKAVLQNAGIAVAGGVRREPIAMSEVSVLAVHRTPLSNILERSLSDSQNLFAECLMKAAGTRTGRQGSWHSGRQVITAALQSWGLDTSTLVIADGSGLSRDNRLSARHVTAVLQRLYLDEVAGSVFMDSLALNGRRGTLRKRVKDQPGRVWGKTGYMRGIRTMSGYVQGNGGWYAFAVLFNDIAGGTAPYNELHDKVCRILINDSATASKR